MSDPGNVGPVPTDPTERDDAVMIHLDFVWLYDWLMAAFERHLDAED